MSTWKRQLGFVMACGTSLAIVASSCDHACSSEAVERVPRIAVPDERFTRSRQEPEVAEMQPQDSPLQPAEPYESPEPKPKPPPRPTEIDDLTIADGHTPSPTSAEWLAAAPLHTSHPHCRARVVREWMTIHCTTPETNSREALGIVRVLAGDAAEIQQWSYTAKQAEDQAFPTTTSAAIFPVRRGDRRLLELSYVSHGAHPRFDHIDAYTISVAWLEGMKSPDVTVTES